MLFVQAWMIQDFEAAALYGTELAVEGIIMQKVPTPDLTTIECNEEFCLLTDVDPNERDYYVIFDPNTHEVQNAGQDKPVCIRADIDFAALRSEPNLDAELLVEMPAGSCRGVYFSDAIASGNGFDWYQLRWNGIDGWVAASNLQGA